MNSSQIKAIREALSTKRRHLREKFTKSQPKPPEILAAEKLVEDYKHQEWLRLSAIREVIDDKVNEIEMELILGSDHKLLLASLKELDAWKPELPPVEAPSAH